MNRCREIIFCDIISAAVGFYIKGNYEKYDKAPWKEYGHGELGYLELYLENKEKYSNEFKTYFKPLRDRNIIFIDYKVKGVY